MKTIEIGKLIMTKKKNTARRKKRIKIITLKLKIKKKATLICLKQTLTYQLLIFTRTQKLQKKSNLPTNYLQRIQF